MKSLRRSLIGFCLVACAGLFGAELSTVPFFVGKQQFKPGDAIVIDQVLATSPRLDVGTKMVVRGHYRLATADKARLGLFLTHRGFSSSSGDASAASQTALAVHDGGSFELSCEITYEGDPHISFYPASAGEAFGGIYFSPVPQKS